CDRIGIIDNGQIIAEGTLDELRKSSSAKETIVITFNNLNDDKVQKIQSFWKDCNHTDDKIYFYTSDLKTELSKISSQCSYAGAYFLYLYINILDLGTFFLSLTGR